MMETIMRFFQNSSYTLLFLVGVGLRLFIGMRRFNRRGLGGLQHFKNYFVGLLTLFAEQLLKWIGTALMLWGLWGWIFG